MGQMIDSCVWIDHLRKGTHEATRRMADAVLNCPDALLCEPVRFELLSGASKRERRLLLERLATMPLLRTPPDVWSSATSLAADLCDSGMRVPPLDLLISVICLQHGATLVTFDRHFEDIAKISGLRVELLVRPG